MLKFLFALLITLTSACAQDNKLAHSEATKQTTHISIDKLIDFQNVNFKGILIGENIKLLDDDFDEIKDISYLSEQFVEIVAVSKVSYKLNPADEYCDEAKYIRIKTKDFEGYVDGRKVFQLLENNQRKSVTIANNEISLIPTSYFGIGVANDDGLTFCSSNTPVIFKDVRANYEGLVKMVKNKNYEGEYPYFEIREDDGAYDQIKSIEKQGNKYLVKIEREYQEGGANLLISIYKDKSGIYYAEILEHKNIEE